MNTHARTREPHAQYILATKTAWQARAVAGLEARSRHALGVSASPRSRVTVRESGSGLPCHGSDGALLPAATAERCEAGGAAAAADQTPRRVSAAAAASPRECGEETYAPPLYVSSAAAALSERGG
ncbi:hypothetical protein EMIHUDRAFT_254366 [Emiliania huxleyi CCMP1516]|uniref:Uncharacterized protein n=2 Tax=Emiliania huxleyi TaxID=2903 RepID=A0A0D3JTY0_EMIH1|nr:hypothetical protein EMIHUDRAFT_254366 [Emiliania huxleyi CCMP1516]EOD26965.1 hypothetical protein EMIHUDRAFT_254366 [Emiliania huxleyi CCMP1516]|eukprot:XP_005779394.1 hypothetical protein EMIHUDRAFT_254366 [Emiliania huxleyi CCMP1516]